MVIVVDVVAVEKMVEEVVVGEVPDGSLLEEYREVFVGLVNVEEGFQDPVVAVVVAVEPESLDVSSFHVVAAAAAGVADADADAVDVEEEEIG